MPKTAAATVTAEKPAPKVKKTPAQKAEAETTAPKSNKAPKSAPMPDGKSVHADEPKREPVWNDRRKGIVMAMRALGATGVTTARTAEEIGAKAGKIGDVNLKERVDIVKIHLDVYRTAELVHNEFAASCKHEGERTLRYYLTKKGQTTKFPAPEKKTPAEKPAKAEKTPAPNGKPKPAPKKKAEVAAK